MAQKVREVMTSAPVTVRPDTPVTAVAQAMRDNNIGDVLVTDNGTLQGLVTDRDIVVRAVAGERDPATTPVRALCSAELITVGPDQDADTAVLQMRKHSVRRVPVVENGRPVGVLSLGDMAMERDERSALADISAGQPNN
jgi:CBS domain-containing protein